MDECVIQFTHQHTQTRSLAHSLICTTHSYTNVLNHIHSSSVCLCMHTLICSSTSISAYTHSFARSLPCLWSVFCHTNVREYALFISYKWIYRSEIQRSRHEHYFCILHSHNVCVCVCCIWLESEIICCLFTHRWFRWNCCMRCYSYS